jgi:hypothetical protein
MWYFERNVEDSSFQEENNGVSKMNLSPSWMTLLDSEEQPDVNDSIDNTLAPLPCPCSESTLESHGIRSDESNCQLQHLEEEGSQTDSTLSSETSSDHDIHQHTVRHVVRGVLAGSVLSLFFMTFAIIFASDSTLKWAGFMHHRIRSFAIESGVTNVLQLGAKRGKSAPIVNRSTRVNRRLRDHLATDVDDPIHTTRINEKQRVFTTISRKLIHDVELDEQLVKEFFRQPRKVRVYQSNETSTHNNTKHRYLHHSRRVLQSSSISKSDPVTDDMTNPSTDNPVPNTPPKDPQLVVAGKLTVADGPCNVAQMNLKSGEWSLQQRIQLSLYNSYSGGEVYSLLANHTITTNSNAKEFRAEGTSSKGG